MTESLTPQFISYDINDLYQELKGKAEAEGVTQREAFDVLAEDLINDKISNGEIDKDEETEDLIQELKNKWPIYEKNLNFR